MCVHPRQQGEWKAAFLLTLIGNRCWRKPRQQRKCFGKFSGLSLPFLGPGPGNQSLQSTLWSLGWTKHFYWMKTWTWALGADVLGKLLNPTQLTVKESENICLVNWTVTKACFNPDELSVHVQADSEYISTVLQIYTFEMDCFSSCYSFNCLTKRNLRRIRKMSLRPLILFCHPFGSNECEWEFPRTIISPSLHTSKPSTAPFLLFTS